MDNILPAELLVQNVMKTVSISYMPNFGGNCVVARYFPITVKKLSSLKARSTEPSAIKLY